VITEVATVHVVSGLTIGR